MFLNQRHVPTERNRHRHQNDPIAYTEQKKIIIHGQQPSAPKYAELQEKTQWACFVCDWFATEAPADNFASNLLLRFK